MSSTTTIFPAKTIFIRDCLNKNFHFPGGSFPSENMLNVIQIVCIKVLRARCVLFWFLHFTKETSDKLLFVGITFNIEGLEQLVWNWGIWFNLVKSRIWEETLLLFKTLTTSANIHSQLQNPALYFILTYAGSGCFTKFCQHWKIPEP